LKISTRSKNTFGNTYQMVEGFCFVVSVTGFNTSNIGKDADDKNLII
jgi:hypothetical protein